MASWCGSGVRFAAGLRDPSKRRVPARNLHSCGSGVGEATIWGRGWREPVGAPRARYRKEALKFILHGRKLKGAWALVRMRGKDGDRPRHRKENWLLITARDTLARVKPRAR